jgi:phosphoribosylformylglycinamidine synthase
MVFGGRGEGEIGAEIDLEKVPAKNLREEKKLFAETGGFIVEISPACEKAFLTLCAKNELKAHEIGKTTKLGKLVFKNSSKALISLPIGDAAESWLNGLRKKL